MVNVGQRSRFRRLAAGRSIAQAVWSALQRTLSNPISLAFAVFTLSYFFLEVIGGKNSGPLENIVTACTTALADPKVNTVEKTLLNIIKGTAAYLAVHKVKVGVLSAYLVPYSLRPNTTNSIVCFCLAVLTLCTSTIAVKSHYLFALIFWLYTQVDSPRHRSYVATAGLLTILIYFEVITIVGASGGGGVGGPQNNNTRKREVQFATGHPTSRARGTDI